MGMIDMTSIVKSTESAVSIQPYYVVVRPGKSPQDIVGFFCWSGPNKPFTSLLPRIFYSRTLAQIVADQLSESGEVWVVWNCANIVQEMSDTYSACAERASYVSCGECSVPHNKWTGCPKLGGKIPPYDYSCGQGERK